MSQRAYQTRKRESMVDRVPSLYSEGVFPASRKGRTRKTPLRKGGGEVGARVFERKKARAIS